MMVRAIMIRFVQLTLLFNIEIICFWPGTLPNGETLLHETSATSLSPAIPAFLLCPLYIVGLPTSHPDGLFLHCAKVKVNFEIYIADRKATTCI